MKTYALLVALTWGLLIIFAALNWEQFSATRDLSLLVTHVQWPLGLVLLGAMLILTTILLAALVHAQANAHLLSRRHTDLRGQLETSLAAHEQRMAELRTDLLAELGRQGEQLQSAVEQAGNTLAAYVGELEDRLDRIIGPPNVG